VTAAARLNSPLCLEKAPNVASLYHPHLAMLPLMPGRPERATQLWAAASVSRGVMAGERVNLPEARGGPERSGVLVPVQDCCHELKGGRYGTDGSTLLAASAPSQRSTRSKREDEVGVNCSTKAVMSVTPTADFRECGRAGTAAGRRKRARGEAGKRPDDRRDRYARAVTVCAERWQRETISGRSGPSELSRRRQRQGFPAGGLPERAWWSPAGDNADRQSGGGVRTCRGRLIGLH
jgi:hypothetical protein